MMDNNETREYILQKYEGRYLKISGSTRDYFFQVYKLEGYDFNSNLRFTEGKHCGVYIFSKREVLNPKYDAITIGRLTSWKEIARHQLLYCGRTDDLNKRFEDHHKAKDLEGADFNCLSILTCENHEETEQIERYLLNEHNFKFNEVLNNWEPAMEEVASEEPLTLQGKSI